MTRHNRQITDYPLKGAIDTGIKYSLYFEGWQACIAAGLDVERWESSGYDRAFMARAVAWYRLSRLVDQHSQAAIAAKVK